MQLNRTPQLRSENVGGGGVNVVDHDYRESPPIEDAKVHTRPNLPRQPHQNRLRLFTQLVSLKGGQTEAHEREAKPVFLGFGILIHITVGPEERQYPVNITRQ